jgi:hypothetical protein
MNDHALPKMIIRLKLGDQLAAGRHINFIGLSGSTGKLTTAGFSVTGSRAPKNRVPRP